MNNSRSSQLSDPSYGCDFVVAITQQSINHALKQFLDTHETPEISVCYVDNGGRAVEAALNEVMSISGVDPFQVPHDTNVQDPQIQRLNEARFIRGWRARLGIPDMTDPSQLGNLVELTSSNETVQVNMLCAEFQVVSYIDRTRFSPSRWINVRQPRDHPWIFTSRVALTRRVVNWTTHPQDVPAPVLDTLHGLQQSHESIFTVEHLLLDLESADLMTTTPTIDGLTEGTPEYSMLKETFLGTYFEQMKRNGEPLISSTIKKEPQPNAQPPSSVHLTDFRYSISPYVDTSGNVIASPNNSQKKAATINYLCAVDEHRLRPTVPFTWNWMDVSELSDSHGTISIRRNYLADYLSQSLKSHISTNCIEARPTWSTFDPTVPRVTWEFPSPAVLPAFTIPEEGPVVLRLDFCSGICRDESWSGVSYAEAQTHYNIAISFQGNTITIYQCFILHVKAKQAMEWAEADVVHRTHSNTYEIAVNARGKLESTALSPVSTDTSKELDSDTILFFNAIMRRAITNQVNVHACQLSDIPFSFAQNFVFPAGKAFIFKRVEFSDHQDLVSHITYADI